MRERVIILLSIFFTAVLTLGLSESYRYYNSYNTVPSLDEQIFAKELRNKAHLRNDFMVSVGPYHVFRSFMLGDNYTSINIDIDLTNSSYLFCSAGTCYIMFDYEFYKRLSEKERRFIIVHEFLHVRRWEEKGIRVPNLPRDKAIEEEKRADAFALTSGIEPETILQFLNIYCEDDEEKEARIENIKKLMRD